MDKVKPDLLEIEPSRHLSKEIIDQLVIDRGSLEKTKYGDNQQGAHGTVVTGAANAQTLDKVNKHGVAIKVATCKALKPKPIEVEQNPVQDEKLVNQESVLDYDSDADSNYRENWI